MNSLLSAQYNTSRVLRLLWLNPGISRAGIADRLGLNRSTITHIVKELTDQGLVETQEGGRVGPSGGRKNVRLVVNKKFGCIAGFDVHPDLVRLVVVDLSGDMILQHERKVKLEGKHLYDGLREAYEDVQSRARALDLPLLGVGCGVSGIVRPEENTIQQSIPLGITRPEAFGKKLGAFVREPIFVENDANCCCWGEIAGNRSEARASFLFVNGDWRKVKRPFRGYMTSIGMGVVINDMVHHGKDFSAGEFRSIGWRVGNSSQFSMSDEDISGTKGDRSRFLNMVRELARNTALLVNVLNLERLYLGGFFQADDGEVRDIFREEIRRNWSYPNQPACDVTFSTYGKNAVAYGAAGLFLARTFEHSARLVLAGSKAGLRLLTG